MNTADLIVLFSDELRAVDPRSAQRTIGLAVLGGIGACLILLLLTFGVQPGLGHVSRALPLAMKVGYASYLAVIAFAWVVAQARPATPAVPLWPRLPLPAAMLGFGAALELLRAKSAQWPSLLLGASWYDCPIRITLFSIPIFAILCMILRTYAPVELRVTGLAAGLLSGAAASMVYALACTETSANFVLIWYSAGIAACAALGALFGPRLLRW